MTLECGRGGGCECKKGHRKLAIDFFFRSKPRTSLVRSHLFFWFHAFCHSSTGKQKRDKHTDGWMSLKFQFHLKMATKWQPQQKKKKKKNHNTTQQLYFAIN